MDDAREGKLRRMTDWEEGLAPRSGLEVSTSLNPERGQAPLPNLSSLGWFVLIQLVRERIALMMKQNKTTMIRMVLLSPMIVACWFALP
jgi:hypothetical protein